jgi:hypothetical protein
MNRPVYFTSATNTASGRCADNSSASRTPMLSAKIPSPVSSTTSRRSPSPSKVRPPSARVRRASSPAVVVVRRRDNGDAGHVELERREIGHRGDAQQSVPSSRPGKTLLFQNILRSGPTSSIWPSCSMCPGVHRKAGSAPMMALWQRQSSGGERRRRAGARPKPTTADFRSIDSGQPLEIGSIR